MSDQPLTSAVALIICIATLGTPTLSAAEGDGEVSTGVVVRTIARVHPVLGADEKIHLVYELEIVNHSSMVVLVDRVEALGSAGGRLVEFEGNALAQRTMVSGGENGKLFGPSHSGYVFMDIALPRSSALPATIRHQIVMTSQRPESGAEHNTAPDPTARLKGQATTFLGLRSQSTRRLPL